MGRKFGFSFSMNRALGISAAKGRLSRKIGIPLTKSGRERKCSANSSVARESRLGTGSWVMATLHHSTAGRGNSKLNMVKRFRNWDSANGTAQHKSCALICEQCYTIASVRAEPGVSSARPTKQDSASGRLDSSSAIQSRKHEQNGTRNSEVV